MPIDREHVLRVVQIARQAGLRELEVRTEGRLVRLVRAKAGEDAERTAASAEGGQRAPAEAGDGIVIIRSEKVALFHRGRGPGEPPLVEVGTEVKEGQVVATLEALRKLTDVVAPHDGVVLEILAEDGRPVEYGESLVALRVQ